MTMIMCDYNYRSCSLLQHIFHETCILPWLELHGTCPICRDTFVDAQQQQQQDENADDEAMDTDAFVVDAATANRFENLLSDMQQSKIKDIHGMWTWLWFPFSRVTNVFNKTRSVVLESIIIYCGSQISNAYMTKMNATRNDVGGKSLKSCSIQRHS